MTTPKMLEIQEREGKPIKQVIADLYEKYKDAEATQQAVADELRISQPTLSLWLIKLGLKQVTVLTDQTAKEPCQKEVMLPEQV